MSKKNILEDGQIYAIQLSNGIYTVAQLLNHHQVSPRTSQDTFAFFDYKFDCIENIVSEELNIKRPFAIATSNSRPKVYGWKLIGKREIVIEFEYKNKISSLGMYNNSSADPSIFLEPYFGLFPWDGYYKDDYLDKYLLPNVEKGENLKYLKDFTTNELKKLLPENSPKLISRLEQ